MKDIMLYRIAYISIIASKGRIRLEKPVLDLVSVICIDSRVFYQLIIILSPKQGIDRALVPLMLSFLY